MSMASYKDPYYYTFQRATSCSVKNIKKHWPSHHLGQWLGKHHTGSAVLISANDKFSGDVTHKEATPKQQQQNYQSHIHGKYHPVLCLKLCVNTAHNHQSWGSFILEHEMGDKIYLQQSKQTWDETWERSTTSQSNYIWCSKVITNHQKHLMKRLLAAEWSDEEVTISHPACDP